MKLTVLHSSQSVARWPLARQSSRPNAAPINRRRVTKFSFIALVWPARLAGTASAAQTNSPVKGPVLRFGPATISDTTLGIDALNPRISEGWKLESSIK